jgi:hypothetical protein
MVTGRNRRITHIWSGTAGSPQIDDRRREEDAEREGEPRSSPAAEHHPPHRDRDA